MLYFIIAAFNLSTTYLTLSSRCPFDLAPGCYNCVTFLFVLLNSLAVIRHYPLNIQVYFIILQPFLELIEFYEIIAIIIKFIEYILYLLPS